MQFIRTLTVSARVLSLSLALLAVADAGRAGEEPKLKFKMRREPAIVVEDLNQINLRPNTPTTVSIYVHNPTKERLADVAVKLVHVVGDQVVVLAEKVTDLPPNQDTRIEFPAKVVKDKEVKFELAGPPFKLQLLYTIGSKKVLDVTPVSVSIKSPREFMDVAAQYDRDKKRLSFRVRLLKDTLIGPKGCPVQLEVGPQLRDSIQGTFKQVLTEPDKVVELFAEDVDPPNEEGAVMFLHVDGYERAFTFTINDVGEVKEFLHNNRVGVRLHTPQYSVPTDKLPVVMELDGPLDAPYKVELAIDRAGKKEQEGFQGKTFNSIREQRAILSISPKGDLVWVGEARQWRTEFDAADIFGAVWLRMRVYDKDQPVDLVITPGTLPGNTVVVRDNEDPKSLFAKVYLDPTVPVIDEEDLKRTLAKNYPPGAEIIFKVRIRHQAIDKIMLLRGKAPADGKINPDAILDVVATPRDGPFKEQKPGFQDWLLKLPKQEKSDPLDVSVVAFAKTGRSSARSATVTFAAPPEKNKLATIKGRVMHGIRLQPMVAVTLLDAKGNTKGSTKTNTSGEFVFEKVMPGDYVIASMTTSPVLVAREKVSIPEGVTEVPLVTLKLLSK